MRLNMTSPVPVDKPLNFPGHVPCFCELCPHFLWVKGKEVQPAPLRAPLYQNSFSPFMGRRGSSGIPDHQSGLRPEPPMGKTTSSPDFCLPNAAEYDLTSSRRQTSQFSGPCSVFCELCPPFRATLGKRGTTGTVKGSVVPEFFQGLHGPERVFRDPGSSIRPSARTPNGLIHIRP